MKNAEVAPRHSARRCAEAFNTAVCRWCMRTGFRGRDSAHYNPYLITPKQTHADSVFVISRLPGQEAQKTHLL
jgi:hypothetical protein